jgi:hypothetical protein
MHKIREVLWLKHELGLENRQIAKCCRISHVSVGNYLARFSKAGLDWPLGPEWDDGRLSDALFGVRSERQLGRELPSLIEIHCELHRPKVTLQLLWEEYRTAHPGGYGYSQFCEHYRRFAAKLDPVLRQEHRAGERMFTDFAGPTIPVYDPRTGEITPAHLFVAVLGASNYTFATATRDQGLEEWLLAPSAATNSSTSMTSPVFGSTMCGRLPEKSMKVFSPARCTWRIDGLSFRVQRR